MKFEHCFCFGIGVFKYEVEEGGEGVEFDNLVHVNFDEVVPHEGRSCCYIGEDKCDSLRLGSVVRYKLVEIMKEQYLDQSPSKGLGLLTLILSWWVDMVLGVMGVDVEGSDAVKTMAGGGSC